MAFIIGESFGGGHTREGLPATLPQVVRPGCQVCVLWRPQNNDCINRNELNNKNHGNFFFFFISFSFHNNEIQKESFLSYRS